MISAQPGPDTLQQLRRELSANGENAAIIAFTGEAEEAWSFAKLGDVSTRLAAGLVRRGISRGDSVALIAPNSPQWIVAFWAIIGAGAVAVPLDAQSDDHDLKRMIEISACRLAFSTTADAKRLQVIAPSCGTIILDRESDPATAESWRGLLGTTDTSLPTVTPTEPATIVFTSGTTGAPKAAPLSHANLLANVLALAALRIVGPGDRALLPLPLYHVYPLTIGMITPLAMGCGIVLPAGISGPEIVAASRRGRVTVLVGVPRLYTALLDNIRRGIVARPRLVAALIKMLLKFACWAQRHGTNWPGKILLTSVRQQFAPRLRLLVSGGAAVDVEVEETLDAMGWEMLTGYGLVETSSMLSFNPPGAALPGSAGRPVPGMQVRIANPDADGVGEIEVRGPSLFAGYRNDPAKTKEAFTPDGWFRTGDLGSIDRLGYLHIAARKTETIVLADGKKLFPEEFEAVYGTAPLVREIALLGQNGALVALVVPDLAAARDLVPYGWKTQSVMALQPKLARCRATQDLPGLRLRTTLCRERGLARSAVICSCRSMKRRNGMKPHPHRRNYRRKIARCSTGRTWHGSGAGFSSDFRTRTCNSIRSHRLIWRLIPSAGSISPWRSNVTLGSS